MTSAATYWNVILIRVYRFMKWIGIRKIPQNIKDRTQSTSQLLWCKHYTNNQQVNLQKVLRQCLSAHIPFLKSGLGTAFLTGVASLGGTEGGLEGVVGDRMGGGLVSVGVPMEESIGLP